MNTYRYYALRNGAVVGVRQPEQRYTHVGDLSSIRTFVRVVGRQYDGSIGEFGIGVDTLGKAVEILPTTAVLREPRLERYIETHLRQAGPSSNEQEASDQLIVATGRVRA